MEKKSLATKKPDTLKRWGLMANVLGITIVTIMAKKIQGRTKKDTNVSGGKDCSVILFPLIEQQHQQ